MTENTICTLFEVTQQRPNDLPGRVIKGNFLNLDFLVKLSLGKIYSANDFPGDAEVRAESE